MWFLQSGITFEHVLIRILAILAVVFFSLPFHEYAHAYVANKLGDSTAKNLDCPKRLWLNGPERLPITSQ